jgi:hypothetical protein
VAPHAFRHWLATQTKPGSQGMPGEQGLSAASWQTFAPPNDTHIAELVQSREVVQWLWQTESTHASGESQ